MYEHSEYEVFPVVVPAKSILKSINFYIVKTKQALFLIDAGLDDDRHWEALNRTLTENGFTIRDLTAILLTHHHVDHVGLVNRIVAKHPIPVYAHPLAFPRLRRDDGFLQRRIDFFAKLYEEMNCGEDGVEQVNFLKEAMIKNKANRIDGALLPLSNSHFQSFELIPFPGHAPDQIGFYVRDKKELFCGDLLIEHISSNALVEPDEDGNKIKSLSEHVASYKKCLTLNADIVYSGHGEPLTNIEEIIAKRLSGIERKTEKFLLLIASGNTTGSEIAKQYYKETYKKQFSLVMSEVIGHLDYLEAEQKVAKEFINGKWHYRTIS